MRRLGVALAASALVAGGLSACGEDDSYEAVPPVSAELTAKTFDDGVKIGVITTLGNAEGSEWRDAAEGIRVAVARFAMGGTKISVVNQSDGGTYDGAAKAVDTLVDQGVSGIIVASSGEHVEGAVKEAGDTGVPLLLPYDTSTKDLPPNAWLTGPDDKATSEALQAAVKAGGITSPFVINAGGGIPAGFEQDPRRPYYAGSDPSKVAKVAAKQTQRRQDAADGIVISGTGPLQGQIVQALQRAGADVPYVLTSDALSPVFASTLSKSGGSLSGEFLTAGPDVGEPAALRPSGQGRALAAYYSGMRLAAENTSTKDLLGERSFASVAGSADVRSHDAVVALVRAAERSLSQKPSAVAEALRKLQLGADDGLAGPALDFSASVAMSEEDVVPLQASDQTTGLRPTSKKAEPHLAWFSLPKS